MRKEERIFRLSDPGVPAPVWVWLLAAGLIGVAGGVFALLAISS